MAQPCVRSVSAKVQFTVVCTLYLKEYTHFTENNILAVSHGQCQKSVLLYQ